MSRAQRQASIGRTNEKLYHAQLHLEAWAQLQGDEERFNPRAWALSYSESVLFHLELAWESFLAEIAEFYKVPRPQDLTDLGRQLQAAGIVSPEWAQLQAAAEDVTSFLAQLLTAYAHLRVPSPEAATATAVGRVAVAEPGPDRERLHAWWQGLRALIDAQRRQMQEW